jgi:hypothetical protein
MRRRRNPQRRRLARRQPEPRTWRRAASLPPSLAAARQLQQDERLVHPQALPPEDGQSPARKGAWYRLQEWRQPQVAPDEQSTAPGAAEAQSCVALAWPLAAARSRLALGEQRDGQQPKPAFRQQVPRVQNRKLEDAPLPVAQQGAPETGPAAPLPASWPESPSARRPAWRCWRGQSWDDFPARCASLPPHPTPQDAIRVQNNHELALPHPLQWNSNGSCPRPYPWIPERRESAYS